MWWFGIPLAAIALLGHLALCVALFNLVHRTAWPYQVIRIVSIPAQAATLVVPVVFGVWVAVFAEKIPARADWTLVLSPWSYPVACWGVAAVAAVVWIRRQFNRPRESLLANHTSVVTLPVSFTGNRLTALLARIPGNQILQIHVQEKTVELPRLNPALDGLSIAHLSDLHFTGQLTKAFYRQVMELVNDFQADIVAVTGDIVDKTACVEWVPDTIGRLRARYGVFFVLGNHDLRVRNLAILRQALADTGMIDLAGRWTMVEIRHVPVVLAGNELPWIGPAADLNDCPVERNGVRPLRIALAHTPDQIGWAQAGRVDLMLAGHTHGGQVRPPLVGPIVSCSRRDIRKIAGVFFESPTLLHISRGIAGTRQLRINCPPELTKLVLRCPASP